MLIKRRVYSDRRDVREIHELHRIRTRKTWHCEECGKELPAGSEVYCHVIKSIKRKYDNVWGIFMFPERVYYCLECGYRELTEGEIWR